MKPSPATVAVTASLASISALHAAWALGSPWPAPDLRVLAEHVLGAAERARYPEMPPPWMSWSVAGACAVGATVVARSGTRPTRSSRWLAAAGAVVLAGRGGAGVLAEVRGRARDPFNRLDRAVYSPLCLALAAGIAAVLRSGGHRVVG
ncbi:DUF3995 domain-containing protein [Pseudonocardia sp. TRM90224]|uniref:DUF3995 domain-containing protein n=1 Tax=Pseudonocardia sp. TRM90224 TaxID=2812678 RepID=UPI001E4500E9|nr:DUF3995 domain-containing protein [Pseudonocardia sp. TRM90224]